METAPSTLANDPDFQSYNLARKNTKGLRVDKSVSGIPTVLPDGQYHATIKGRRFYIVVAAGLATITRRV